MRMLLLVFVLLLLSACAGRSAIEPQSELSLGEALAQLDGLTAPLGSDPQQFDQLRASFRAQLLASGRTRWVSAAPGDTANRVNDLYLTRVDDATATARWTYRNVGDYDLNSVVNISDLSALGAHLNKTTASPDWAAARGADGDGNGVVNISDLTPWAAICRTRSKATACSRPRRRRSN